MKVGRDQQDGRRERNRWRGGWGEAGRGRLRRGRLWEVLGEAGTGCTRTGIMRGWRRGRAVGAWRGTRGDEGRGETGKRGRQRDGRFGERTESTERERDRQKCRGVWCRAQERRRDSVDGRRGRWRREGRGQQRSVRGTGQRTGCTMVVGGKMEVRCHAITPCTTLHTQGALSLHPPPPLPHAPRNPHIQPPPPPSSQLSPVCAGSEQQA